MHFSCLLGKSGKARALFKKPTKIAARSIDISHCIAASISEFVRRHAIICLVRGN